MVMYLLSHGFLFSSITKFETISNELLMVLFEYYDLYSLFYSFSSLNSRIDQILYRCNAHIDLDQVRPIDFIHFLSRLLPTINTKKIRSLKSSEPEQISILAHDQCLQYFQFIRSLSLKKSRMSIIQEMIRRMGFPHLERVSFDYIENDNLSSASLFQHFMDPNRFRFLRIYKDKYSEIDSGTSLLPIEYLSVNECAHSTDFFNFLKRAPFLKSIKIAFGFTSYPEPILFSSIATHDTLIHVDVIMVEHFNEELIIHLFKSLPRLRRLKLRSFPNSCPRLVVPFFWETSFSIYLTDLQEIYLDAFTTIDIASMNLHWNALLNTEEVREKINKSNYWSSRGWKPIFDIYQTTPPHQNYCIRFAIL